MTSENTIKCEKDDNQRPHDTQEDDFQKSINGKVNGKTHNLEEATDIRKCVFQDPLSQHELFQQPSSQPPQHIKPFPPPQNSQAYHSPQNSQPSESIQPPPHPPFHQSLNDQAIILQEENLKLKKQLATRHNDHISQMKEVSIY